MQSKPPVHYDDEIDLRELYRILWVGKWLIFGITIAVTVATIIVALMLPNIYRADALLAPNDQDGVGGLSALAAQYGSLASLTGLNIGSGTNDKTALGLEILKSRRFVTDFIDRHDILVPLMAAKGWIAATGELQIDPDAYDVTAKKWIRRVSPPNKTTPSLQEAYVEFMDILSVDQNNKSGFVSVAIEHYSPTIAKQWVDWLVADINSTIMKHDVELAEHAIEYLNKQIQATPLAELQVVFFRLVEEQTKTLMLAKVSKEYMFRTVDPAIAPELRTKPNRTLIVLLGLFVGGLIGVIVVSIKNSFACMTSAPMGQI